MSAVTPSHFAVLLLTTLATTGAGCQRAPRRDGPAGRPIASSAVAAGGPSAQPAPALAPPEPTALAVAPPAEQRLPVAAPVAVQPRPLTKPRAITPKPLPPDDLTTLRKMVRDDEPGDPAGVADGMAAGVPGGVEGAVAPMASDPRPRTLPVPAPDNAVPAFPPDADPAITDARVTLRVSIDLDGSVGAVHAVSGTAPFTTAALATARSWHFRPATVAGSPVATTINMVVAFRR